MFGNKKDLLIITLIIMLLVTLGSLMAVLPGSRNIILSFYGAIFENNQEEAISNKDAKSLKGLGYVGGSQKDYDDVGIRVHENNKTYDGANFFCGGQGPEAILMSMDGKVKHEWEYSYFDAYSDTSLPEGGMADPDARKWWRNCFLMEDGSVLAIFEGWGLIRVNKHSELLWAHKGGFHHDLVQMNEKFYVINRKVRKYTKGNEQGPIVEDFIVVLDKQGQIRKRYSILDSVLSSNYTSLVTSTRGNYTKGGASVELRSGDALHPNSLEILSEDHEFVRKVSEQNGLHALISCRNNNAIFLMSLQSEKVVWAISNLTQAQHDAHFLPNGNLLVFDNWGNHRFNRAGKNTVEYKNVFSRILEIDALNQEIKWSYSGDPENEFFSKCCGQVQRLPNGNTLIVSTSSGRAFEVTSDKEIVWDFVNQKFSAENLEIKANIFKLRRILSDQYLNLLDELERTRN